MRAGEQGRRITILADYEALSAAAADAFVQYAEQVVAARGRVALGLSGGATPKRMYELLAEQPRLTRVHWEKTDIFWVDERCISPRDPRSNYRLAAESLLRHLPTPARVHRIQGELPAAESARSYDAELRGFFGADGNFDLLLMGVGEDGHTASLFPGEKSLSERERWAIDAGPGPEGLLRVSLTLPAICSAARIMFLASGAAKAAMVRQAFETPQPGLAPLPVQLVQAQARYMDWFLDRGAARALPSS